MSAPAAAGRRPVLAVVTPWFPNSYEPVLGIFVAQQVEALRTEMDVRLIHLQLSCELPLQKFRDRLRRRIRPYVPVTSVVPDITLNLPFRWTARVLGEDGALRLLSARLRRALLRLGKVDAALGWVAWPTGVAVSRSAKSLGIPAAVMECSGPFASVLRSPAIIANLRALFGGGDTIFTVSPLMTRHIKTALGVEFTAHETGCVVRDALFDLPLERAKSSTTKILCVGGVCYDKGQNLLIEAAAKMKEAGREDFEITCAGFGPELETFRLQAVSAGVDHLVKFPGGVTEVEKLRLYSEADFFVTPTLHDTFGTVVAEAMAAGLPVVSTPNGAAEWIVDERTGLLCAPNNSASLAETLTRMIAGCRAYDRSVIRERVRSLFSAAACARTVRTALKLDSSAA